MKIVIRLFPVLVVSAFLAVSCAFFVSAARAQTATFFASKDNATEYSVFRYTVSPTTSPVLETTITDSSMSLPLGLTLSPAGELFVVNQGTSGGFVTRFLDPTGTSVFNGNIPAGPEATFYGAFRGNELFVSQQNSGVLRFIVDPTTGQATPNGQISITATIGPFRGVVVTPWGELFVAEANSTLPTKIHRFTFDTNGNAFSNGVIINPNVKSTHGMAFSSWGELFTANPSTHSIGRFTFDTAKNASFNGSITGGGLDQPLDVSFAPWGELFVGNCLCQPAPRAPGAYPGISRFNFDNAHVASSNGVVTTPLPISGITFQTDSTPPVITPTITGTLGNNGWYTSDLEVSWSVADPESTVSTTGCDTTAVTTDTSGVTFTCSGTSAGGTDTQSVTVKRDATAPLLTILSPTNGTYLLNQAVTVDFSCSDALSGVATCVGSSLDGSVLDTATTGPKTLTVNSTDEAGNAAAAATFNYTVVYGIEVLFDQTKAHKSGSTVPVRVRLIDANGAYVSSVLAVLHVVGVIQVNSHASTNLDDAGNANSDFDFRYDADLGGYIFNLKTTGYGTGTYLLNFVVGNGQTVYSVGFQVRQ